MEDLLSYKSNIYSQNGEDGIIAAIFDRMRITIGTCCEFGAWDGIHLSNCRHLIDQNWSALMIEGDSNRFRELVLNYKKKSSVLCVNKYVDEAKNSLDVILKENGIKELDFLSIDVDGLDYAIFEAMDFRPKVVCVEVNAAHNPDMITSMSRNIAMDNIGQPLQVFVEIAKKKGYGLICYTGNAFFVRNDLVEECSFLILTSKQAYLNFLNSIDISDKEWLFLVNLGIVNPYRRFRNPYLRHTTLGISGSRIFWIIPLNIFKTVRAIWVDNLRSVFREKSLRVRRVAKNWIKRLG